jgi:hypothetical protein
MEREKLKVKSKESRAKKESLQCNMDSVYSTIVNPT